MSNFKAIGLLVMDILYIFQSFVRYRKCRHESSCSSIRRVSNFNVNALGNFKVIVDGQTHTPRAHTHTHTYRHTHIKPQYNCFARGSTNKYDHLSSHRYRILLIWSLFHISHLHRSASSTRLTTFRAYSHSHRYEPLVRFNEFYSLKGTI